MPMRNGSEHIIQNTHTKSLSDEHYFWLNGLACVCSFIHSTTKIHNKYSIFLFASMAKVTLGVVDVQLSLVWTPDERLRASSDAGRGSPAWGSLLISRSWLLSGPLQDLRAVPQRLQDSAERLQVEPQQALHHLKLFHGPVKHMNSSYLLQIPAQ